MNPAAMRSAMTPGQVAEEGMKPKNLGWSSRAANGSTSSAACSRTSSAGRPSSGGTDENHSASRNSPSQAGAPSSLLILSMSNSIARSASSRMACGSIVKPLPSRRFIPRSPD